MGVGGIVRFGVQEEKRWLTAAEAAAENLPGFPASKSQVNRWATARGVKTRSRSGKGGGREFHWEELPREAREEYLKRYGVAAIEETADESLPAKAARKDLRAHARKLITDAAHAFIRERNIGIEKGLVTFAALYARRKVKLPDWLYAVEPDAAPHRVRAWDRKIRNHGTGALIDSRGRKKHSGLFDRDLPLRNYIVAAVAARPHLSCPQLRLAIAADLNRDIPLRTVQAFVAEFRAANSGALKALTNPDQHRSHHRPAFGSRSADIIRINQKWEIDATRADVMCVLPDGSRRRFALTQVIDVFTRRALVLVSDQPRALATQALLRRAIMLWGLCETLKLDNGKEFAARAVQDFCRDLGIALDFSRPFHPEEKPHVERFFGTLNHALLPLLPAYVGANIAQRKGIEARKGFAHRFGEEAQLVIETSLSPEGLQARVDCWLRDFYEQTPHDGTPLNGRTPFQMALAFGAEAKRIADERALDALLLPAPDGGGVRQVLKKGIRIANRWYIHEELGALCALAARVSVRMDPHDLSRVVVYSGDGREFVCVAQCADDIAPSDMQRIAVQAQGRARVAISRIRDDVRKVQRIYPSADLGDRILGSASDAPSTAARSPSPVNGGGKFTLLPEAARAMAAAESPRLIEHRRAMDALDVSRETPCPEEPTEEALEAYTAHVIEMERRNAPPPVRMTQCDGYSRPSFDEDDFGMFDWCLAHMDILDAKDRALFAGLARDETFQLMRRQRNLRETA